MIAKDSFIILQSGTELTGALCRVGLKSREVSYLHHVTCADLTPQAVASGLRSLLDGGRGGPETPGRRARMPVRRGRAVPGLGLPFRSRAKVEQALS
ncbi:MAG: hypothetical protein ACLSHC_04270 [Bilophila wadsworthia]